MKNKPRLCFVGSMLGRNAGYITTQGQVVADLFASEGFKVECVSSKVNRGLRLADIVTVLVKNRKRFDLVILEVYSGLSLIIADAASVICKLFRIPVIMVLHGGNLPESIEKKPRQTKRVLKSANALIAPSSFLAERIGAHGFKVGVIPNVIELDSYKFRERNKLSPRLLWMRSFHELYNPQMAIYVLAKLKLDYPNATLTMAGVDKGLESEIKQLAAELNLCDSVTFPGFLTLAQKQKLFSESDIFVNTNRTDNMPVAVVEACAFGLPVVATNVGGLPFLLKHGETGILVDSEDVDGMSWAIKSLLEDSQFANKLSTNGRVLAEKSAWTNVRIEWEKLFAKVLNDEFEESRSYSSNDFVAKHEKS
jgi:glycosyltransferase involved in cell wall biosynthesis